MLQACSIVNATGSCHWLPNVGTGAEQHVSSNSISLDLQAPGTLVFTAEMALAGHKLNRCALSLKGPENRDDFRSDEASYLRRFAVPEDQAAEVLARNWTALLRCGGHVQAILFFAATVGESLVHIGGHNAGLSVEELLRICPREVGGLPPSVRTTAEAR